MGQRGVDRLKREILVWLGREPRIRTTARLPVEVHGSDYGAFGICSGTLSEESVVYSVGVGEDVSFDLSLIARYGVTIHAFDPTPRSIAWVHQRGLPAQYRFHPWGVAAVDGSLRFHPPSNPAHVSHRAIPAAGAPDRPVDVTGRRLITIAAELGHDRINLLKMDIEGFEYPVLEDLLQVGPEVDQIAVEFHHHFSEIPAARTIEALEQLNAAGYLIFYVSPRGHEVSLLHKRLVNRSQ
jgi:FkbM family methyltransferase